MDDPAAGPSMAGVNDFWLGGHDHLPGDEKLAGAIEALYPLAKFVTVRNRQFIERAVAYVARAGIRRFADLGSGLATRGTAVLPDGTRTSIVPSHEAARIAAGWGVKVTYADREQWVVDHLNALAAGHGVRAVRADLTDPAAVLAEPAVQAVLGHGPACVLLGMVLQFTDADRARAVVKAYADALSPGSYIILSVPRSDNDAVAAAMKAGYEELSRRSGRPGETVYNHSRDVIASFPGALELVQPGLRVARQWRGGMPGYRLTPKAEAYVLCCVGFKPA